LNDLVEPRFVERTITRPEQGESSVPSTYARLLQRHGYGYPIWIPEGAENLSSAYRDRGISIGDVGHISESGSFRFLFNILEDANQGVNAGPAGTSLTPEGFQRLELDAAREIEVLAFHPADTSICTPCMKKCIERNSGTTS
jgi:hypothetical protein